MSRALGAAFWLAAAGLVGLVLALPALYLVDLPAWVYSGALLRAELADAGATPWRLAPVPVPNTLAPVLPAVLLGVVSPAVAGRLLAAGLLAGGAAAAWALGQAADGREGAPRALVAFACLVVSAPFWNGYLGFAIGIAVAMAAAAEWRRRGALSPAAVLAVLLALFAAHAVPFAVGALAMGMDALRRRDGRAVGALVPAAGLTAAYVLGRPTAGVAPPATAGGLGHAVAYKAYTALKLGPLARPVRLDGTPLIDGPVLAVALGAAALFVAVLVGTLAVQTVRMPAGGARLGALYAWGVAAASLLIPPFALNVVNPGERVLAVAAVGLLATVPLPPRTARALGLAALVFLADDAAALWGQRGGIAPAELAAMDAARSGPAAVPDARFGEAASDATADPAERLLRHDVRLHAELYRAAARHDWQRPAFDSGVLVPDTSAAAR